MERRTLLSVFTVTSTADDGPGSLRQAMISANVSAGTDQVQFNIAGVGVHTIRLLSPLPAAAAITIDGTKQPGYSRSPLVELDGSGAGAFADGLTIGTNGVVRALTINRFGGDGVRLLAATASVTGCYVGTDSAGGAPAGNGGDGISFVGDADSRVNGPTLTGNLISANARNGVRVVQGGAVLSGNLIGVDAAGRARLGNGEDGVQLTGGVATIGPGLGDTPAAAADARNVISGNARHGVHVIAGFVVARGNYIGTGAAGVGPVGNGGHGVLMENSVGSIGGDAGQNSPTIGNVISANRGHGVFVINSLGQNAHVEIRGNRIGTDASGDPSNATLGNGGHGIALNAATNVTVGGEDDAAPNTIAFNGGNGVWISGPDPAAGGGGKGARLLRNSIFSNARLGIDLAAPADSPLTGVTPNDPGDADRGPNGLLNFPVLVSAATRPGLSTVVHFTLDAPRSRTYRVEFFASPARDATGFGEGQVYLGFTNVTVGMGPAGGVAAVLAAPVGSFLTATATDPASSLTSEFSAAAPVTEVAPTEALARDVYSDGIVPDKQALLPGQTGSFANVIGTPRGINGVVIDMALLAQREPLTAADFSFRTRGAADPSRWFNYPARASVVVSPGAGVGGSDRVTVRFLDNFVTNRWLETTVKANERTGLARPDVFYFGSLVGETGDPGSPLRVTALDLAAVKRAMSAPTPPPPGSPFDVNRDGVVNATDLATVWEHLGASLPPLEAPARIRMATAAGG